MYMQLLARNGRSIRISGTRSLHPLRRQRHRHCLAAFSVSLNGAGAALPCTGVRAIGIEFVIWVASRTVRLAEVVKCGPRFLRDTDLCATQ